MAKSSTRKNPELPQEITSKLDVFTDYIKQWTAKEIQRLNSNYNIPLCIPIKNGYRIGVYKLKVLPNKTCELYNNNRELVHVFDNKLSAVLYTIYTIKHQFNSADEIMFWDTEINKNYADVLTLRRSIINARKQQDYETVDIRSARLEIAETRLFSARDKISKLYNHAKYIKVWG